MICGSGVVSVLLAAFTCTSTGVDEESQTCEKAGREHIDNDEDCSVLDQAGCTIEHD